MMMLNEFFVSSVLEVIVFVDPRSIYGPLYEEANNKFPDATRAIKELRWEPRYGRREAIEDTHLYMKDLPERLLIHLRGF